MFLPTRKLERILKICTSIVCVVGCLGIIIPCVIFWRGEYVHVLKSQLVNGEMCPDPHQGSADQLKLSPYPKTVQMTNGWHAVDDDTLFYLFSSYYLVDRDYRYIMLIGAIDKRTYDDLQCAMIDGHSIKYVPASYNAMWDDQLLCSRVHPYYTAIWDDQILCRYSPAFFTCILPKDFKPTSIVLSRKFCQVPKSMLHIVYPSERTRQFTVCVAPLHGPYDDINELVNMIAVNRVLGADFFSFYIYNITQRISDALEVVKSQGLVEIINWNMPINLTKIHYFGQMAALNDCLYRNRHLSQYIVVTDLDEFIIPFKVQKWKEMMLDLPGGLNVYSFQSKQFSIDLPDVEEDFLGKDIAKKYNIVTLLKQKHGPIYDRTTRTKYIVEASRVQELGIHNVWRLRSGSTGNEYHVPVEDALMFHYRHWFNEKEIFSGTKDNTMMTYKDEILKTLQDMHQKIKSST